MSVKRRLKRERLPRRVWMTALTAMGLVLASCATPTPYQPVTKRYGYGEQLIETGRYKVNFSGNSLTKRETVENYLLFRAAEITIETGNDYFIVAERNTDSQTTYRANYSYFPHGSFHYSLRFHGGYRHLYPYYGYGRGFGHDGFYGRPVTRYTATAEIVTFQGNKPGDDAAAYYAREVVENLSPAVVRPERSAD